MARLRPQVGMPVERRAQFRVPNVPRSLISECAPFRFFLWTRPMSSFRTYLFAALLCHSLPQMGSSAVPRVRRSALVIAARTRCWRRAHSTGRGCRVHSCVMAIGADFKMYLLHHFCSNQVEFFYNKQEIQTQKMMDQNFDIWILWFLWPPYVIGQAIIFLPCGFFLSSIYLFLFLA